MSNQKFTWCNDLDGNSQTNSFKVLQSNFGDGYTQRTSVGINNKSGTWAYKRTETKEVIMEIKAFFDAHKGSDSFLWDSPLDGEVRVVASDYTPICLGGLVWSISTTFTQTFEP